ncbi:MAG TPA: TolC family outer membrane protein [Rubrivivax sp.]
MRLSHPLLALIAAVLATLGPGARAQSLQELYEAARAFDATYLAARSQADAAVYRAAQADALNRPSVGLSGSAVAEVIDVPNIGTGDANTVGANLNARYPLFNRANNVTIAQAQKALLASQWDLQSAEQDLIVRVAQAYFDVLTAQDALAIQRSAKVAITEQLASAKRNFEVGTATITDSREAQARFDLATAQEIAAENELRARRIVLDQLVGRSGVMPKGLALPMTLPSTTRTTPDDWVTQADADHPSVQRARLGFDVAKLETEKARAGEMPTVDAVAGLGTSNSAGSAATIAGITSRSRIGVELNWPLYTGGSVQNRIKETLSLEDKARNDLEAVRRGVSTNTRTAYFGLQSGVAQIAALEAAESSAKLALEATRLGYRVGIRINLDVLNAERDLFLTQFDLARARYNVLLGSLKLRQAAGVLKAEDVRALDPYLAR